MYELWQSIQVLLWKKSLKSNMLILFSDVIIQTNQFFIFRDLLNLTMKCIGDQIKGFSFLFCNTSNAKSTKVGEH